MAEFKLFFATDIHGSDLCWKKFLNAGRFYGCSVLVMGGDVTGKMLVPLIDEGHGRWRVRLSSDERSFPVAELPAMRKLVADAGFYPYETTPDEIGHLEAERGAVDALFQRKMTETLERWFDVAEERLRGSGIACYMAPANDDPYFIDPLLARATAVRNPAGQVTELPLGWSMVTVGESNPTPWASPRELPEPELARRIEAETAKLPGMDRAVFNLHVPPKDSQLDTAPLLDDELRPVVMGGVAVVAGVGSTAVREAIERHQPPLSLHGHIHESRGSARLGRTTCLNPGSEYGDGVLRGAIVTLSDRGLKGFQLVAG